MIKELLKFCRFILVGFVCSLLIFFTEINYFKIDNISVIIIIFLCIRIVKSFLFAFVMFFVYCKTVSNEPSSMLCWISQEKLKKIYLSSLNDFGYALLNEQVDQIWPTLQDYQRKYLIFFFEEICAEIGFDPSAEPEPGTKPCLPEDNPFIKELIYFLGNAELRRLIIEIMDKVPADSRDKIYLEISSTYENIFNLCLFSSLFIVFVAGSLIVNLFLV